MSLRKSLASVLRENGIDFGTDSKKLREYSAGNFEGMVQDEDPEMDMVADETLMKDVEQQGFMSEQLPKFYGGGAPRKDYNSRYNRNNPGKPYLLTSKQKALRSSSGSTFLREARTPVTNYQRTLDRYNSSTAGRNMKKYYDKLKSKTKGATRSLIDKIKSNMPEGIFGTGTGGGPTSKEQDIAFNPMNFKQFEASKKESARANFRSNKADPMKGKYVTAGLAQALNPAANSKAAALVANFNLTALNSPTFSGTGISVAKRAATPLTTPGTTRVDIAALRPAQ